LIDLRIKDGILVEYWDATQDKAKREASLGVTRRTSLRA
jgi:hypothetical protein